MTKLNPKRRVKKTIYLDEELYEYFLGLRYSPTEDRIKYGFSDIVNRLLYAERQQLIDKAAAEIRRQVEEKDASDASKAA